MKYFLLFLLLTILSTGCHELDMSLDPPPPPRHSLDIDGDVQLRGTVSRVGLTNEINTQIWAVNMGADTARIETGVCAFNLLAYNSRKENRKLVWYNRMPENYVCFDELLNYNLPSSDSLLLDDQIYISGDNWYWDLPESNLHFELEAVNEKGQITQTDTKSSVIK
ncbi:hypothetical protein [Rhodohalobacter mucosus]|nr:hypothetical protein [Rhodohalobacter mucosus]